MRVVEDLIDAVNRSGRYSGLDQFLRPVLASVDRKRLVEFVFKRSKVLHSLRVVDEIRTIDQILSPCDLAQIAPHLSSRRAKIKGSILRFENAVRRDDGMVVARRPGDLPEA